jgi:hypothetical protein
MYYDQVKAHQEFRSLVEDYIRLSQEEFVAKHPVVKFDPANEDKTVLGEYDQ